MRNKFALFNFIPFAIVVCAFLVSGSAVASTESTGALREKYAALKIRLQQNEFGKPLVIDSSDAANQFRGDVYAVVDHAFATVNARLSKPPHWCDVMILHINTKSCHAVSAETGPVLQVHIGKKTPQELADVARVDFHFKLVSSTPSYFASTLEAREGPMGTSDYLILLEAIPLSSGKTFLHLSYAYKTTLTGNIAMQTYLSTVGRNKVGFTIVGKQNDGQPEYIGGMRGVVERNAMRYYLAIDVFLDAARASPAMRTEKSLQQWFNSTERYPRQLREVDRESYISMKRAEVQRQQGL